uniref:Uncharacterized protein n=1 Tax=Anguilla anguilla TaxID=7936 RepID=A0A0E9QRN1_ANGAN
MTESEIKTAVLAAWSSLHCITTYCLSFRSNLDKLISNS